MQYIKCAYTHIVVVTMEYAVINIVVMSYSW